MRVLFFGSKDRGVRCLEAIDQAGFEVVGVVTERDDTDDPHAFWEGSVTEAAERLGYEVSTPTDVNHEAFLDEVRCHVPDVIVMSGFSQILGSELLEIPSTGVLNLHAGRLPDYRGGSPMNWAIIQGETEATATIHFATARVDAGAVIAEESFDIGLEDTIADARERTLEIFPRLLVDTLEKLQSDDVETRTNDPEAGTYWGSRTPEDGRIVWRDMTARQVYDFVRALTHPYPGAFTTYEDERLYVWGASLLDEDIRHAPGRTCMRRDGGRVVTAKDRGLLLTRVQRDGGRERPAVDVLNRGEYLG